MAENTKIEWADHTFNPWTGCTAVSPACDHCYAEGWAKRSGHVQWGPHGERRRTSEANWRMPLKWDAEAAKSGKRARVFCASLADVFDNHASINQSWRDDLWTLIYRTPHLDWLLLTKRPQNIARYMPPAVENNGIWPNVWLGSTVENQTEADRRIPHLLAVPAKVRFLSCEPLLGPVDLFRWMGVHHHPDNQTDDPETLAAINAVIAAARHKAREEYGMHGLDWVICGGESGPGARPMHPDWARSLRDQCQAAGVAFHFKQWGEWAPSTPHEAAGNPHSGWRCFAGHPHVPKASELYPDAGAAFIERKGKKRAGRLLDGREWNEVPHG